MKLLLCFCTSVNIPLDWTIGNELFKLKKKIYIYIIIEI